MALANGGSNGGSSSCIAASDRSLSTANDDVAGNGNGDIRGGIMDQPLPLSLFNGIHGLFGTEHDCVQR